MTMYKTLLNSAETVWLGDFISIVHDGKTEEYLGSWTFQHVSWHLDLTLLEFVGLQNYSPPLIMS